MTKLIYFFTDLLVIAFIFLNVVAFEFPFMGIPARYYVLILLFSLSFIHPSGTSNKITTFLVVVFSSYLVLATYSLIRGNSVENILSFIKPLFNLLAIPSFKNVFDRYGVVRYLNSFSLACLVLIAIFVVLLVYPEIGVMMGATEDDNQGLLHVYKSGLGDGSRIVIKTFSYLVPFAVYILFRLKGIWYFLFFGAMMAIAVLSQTYGIVIAVAFFYFYILFLRKKRVVIATSIIVAIVLFVANYLLLQDVWDVKSASADVKSMQVMNLFKDMDAISLFFGRGIGCLFTNFDARHVSDTVIEVSAVQIFQMGGLFFSLPILYVYLKPAIDAIKKKNIISTILGCCQVGLLITSLSNPYIWSGCSFLFIIILVANESSHYYLNPSLQKKNIQIARVNNFKIPQ